MIDLLRSLLPPDSYSTFSEQALYWAGESQKATAIPTLVLVAASSLLVLLGWIAVATWLWRRVR